MNEYLATLDDAAYGAATPVVPKFVSPSDPAAQWTGAMKSAAFFAYADNYLIDVKFGIIMDVEASRAVRQAEVGASRKMIKRTEARFGIKPEWLVGDTAYGSAPNLEWLVNEQKIAPYIPVIDKSKREDGTFSRDDFVYDEAKDVYTCPAGKMLTTTGHICTDHAIRYLASVPECRACPLRRRAAQTRLHDGSSVTSSRRRVAHRAGPGRTAAGRAKAFTRSRRYRLDFVVFAASRREAPLSTRPITRRR